MGIDTERGLDTSLSHRAYCDIVSSANEGGSTMAIDDMDMDAMRARFNDLNSREDSLSDMDRDELDRLRPYFDK